MYGRRISAPDALRLLAEHAPACRAPLPLQVVNEGADPVQIVTENMSRPLKPEVDPRVAEAAHHVHAIPNNSDS